MERKPKNLPKLDDYCQEKWAKITANESYKLVKEYNKRLQLVIKAYKSYNRL